MFSLPDWLPGPILILGDVAVSSSIWKGGALFPEGLTDKDPSGQRLPRQRPPFFPLDRDPPDAFILK